MTKTILSVIFMAAIMLTAGIAASVDITGNAIAVHTKNTDGFNVSYSVAAGQN